MHIHVQYIACFGEDTHKAVINPLIQNSFASVICCYDDMMVTGPKVIVNHSHTLMFHLFGGNMIA